LARSTAMRVLIGRYCISADGAINRVRDVVRGRQHMFAARAHRPTARARVTVTNQRTEAPGPNSQLPCRTSVGEGVDCWWCRAQKTGWTRPAPAANTQWSWCCVACWRVLKYDRNGYDIGHSRSRSETVPYGPNLRNRLPWMRNYSGNGASTGCRLPQTPRRHGVDPDIAPQP